MTKNKMQSGPILLVPMSRNAGWASTTVTPLPPASTLPLHTSAIVREDTQGMAHCTATKRKCIKRNNSFFLIILIALSKIFF